MLLPTINNKINESTDFALVELRQSANTCNKMETEDDKCWHIDPVELLTPSQSISLGQKVRTLGRKSKICINIIYFVKVGG